MYSALADTIKLFEQKYYETIIGKTFTKGMMMAQTLPGFVAVKPVSISFCDYQQNCNKARLLFDVDNNKISVQLGNKRYPVKVLADTTSIASDLLTYFGELEDGALTAKSFKGNLYINSVRQFQIGDKRLTVVHLGRGNTAELVDGGTYPPGKEYKAQFAFTDIHKSVFEEPVLHHGHGFDFFIWE